MSTDYSKMSDFEINSAVHNALMQEPYKIEFLGDDRIRWVRGSTDVTTGKVAYSKNSLKDYCNSPADAWPIILANNIALAPPIRNEKGWLGWAVVNYGVEVFKTRNDNPLRAAMIVFLMMQESKSAS